MPGTRSPADRPDSAIRRRRAELPRTTRRNSPGTATGAPQREGDAAIRTDPDWSCGRLDRRGPGAALAHVTAGPTARRADRSRRPTTERTRPRPAPGRRPYVESSSLWRSAPGSRTAACTPSARCRRTWTRGQRADRGDGDGRGVHTAREGTGSIVRDRRNRRVRGRRRDLHQLDGQGRRGYTVGNQQSAQTLLEEQWQVGTTIGRWWSQIRPRPQPRRGQAGRPARADARSLRDDRGHGLMILATVISLRKKLRRAPYRGE